MRTKAIKAGSILLLLLTVICSTKGRELFHTAYSQTVNNQTPRTEPLTIEHDGRRTYGMLSRPVPSAGKTPLVIVSHGFNGTHNVGRNYCQSLTNMGYQVYAFDFNCGSVNSRSDNNTMNMSLLDEIRELKAIVRHFKKQPDIDPRHIVLIGESQGGLVSALTAADMSKDIDKLILVFPALCIPDNWRDRYPSISDIPDTTKLWGVQIGRRYFEEIHDMKPLEMIGKYRRPVLIIQGDADKVVSMEDSKKAVNEVYKDARLHVIPGAGHGFRPAEQQEAAIQIERFLKQRKGK